MQTDRLRSALLTIAVVALAAAAMAPMAFASHRPYGFVGGESGGGAGEFGPGLIQLAVNQATGDVYVADSGNHRVQRFDADGAFELMWGRGVRTGGGAAEICTAAQLPCRAGREGTGEEGTFYKPRWIAISPIDGHVYVRSWASSFPTEPQVGYHIQEFEPDGDFVRMWGWGVENGAAEFQICESDCRAGLKGSGVGQLGGALPNIGTGIAVSPIDGDIFVADPENRRILRFDSDGTLDPSPVIGSAAQFGAERPLTLAIDSQGVLYAVDSEDGGEIERYDAHGAHGTPAFLAPIAAPPLLSATDQFAGSLAVALDPEGDGAAGTTTDHLYVARDPQAGETVIQQFDSPGEVAPPGETLPRHGAGVFEETRIFGLGHDAGSDRFYAASSQVVGGLNGYFVLAEVAGGDAIDTTVAAPSPVASTTATLKGGVDPDNGLARYRFEYSADGGVTWSAEPWRRVSGNGPQPVSEPVEGLQPNKSYLTRLRAEKVLSVSEVVSDTSSSQDFETLTAPPTVTTRPTHAFTDSSAWLAADVNPNNEATSYRFQWGLTSSYGNEAPVSPQPVGSGFGDVAVIEEITGLQPETIYHYRVVAENPSGESFGGDMTFTTRPPFAGHAERAYEQVSPIDKQDADINHRVTERLTPWPASPAGDRKVFVSQRGFGPAEWGGNITPQVYVAERTAGVDWNTIYAAFPPMTAGVGDIDAEVRQMSEDLSKAVVFGRIATFAPFQQPGLIHNDLSQGVRSQPLDSIVLGDGPRGLSADGDTVIFTAHELLVAGTGVPDEDVEKAYAWSAAQGTRLVGVEPGGAPFPGPTEPVAVSANGQQILFEADGELYRRQGGVSTAHITASQRTAPDAPQGKIFEAATGSFGPGEAGAIFFTSTERLTDEPANADAGNGDLYRYDTASGELENISAETNTADGARVLGVSGHSATGDAVYYVARGQVIAGKGAAGQPNLYFWRDDGSPEGETRLVTTLAQGKSCDTEPDADSCTYATSLRNDRAHVTAEGDMLLFQSERPLTGYPNQGHSQVYLYEVEANGGAGALSCVSCRPDGEPSSHDMLASASRLQPSHPLSDDGRVFFESEEALIAQDQNATTDVYEWDQGRLALISSGTATGGGYFDSASVDGESVFLLSRERLVAQDVDDLMDVYVARVGGGLDKQQIPPSEERELCEGEGCKPPIVAPPPSSGGSTSTLIDEGNVRSVPDCRRYGRTARRIAQRAERLAATARKLARSGKPEKAKALRKRAAKLEKRKARLRGGVKRCRAARKGATQ